MNQEQEASPDVGVWGAGTGRGRYRGRKGESGWWDGREEGAEGGGRNRCPGSWLFTEHVQLR